MRFWMAPWPAARLGVLRIALGGFALAWVAIRLPAFANAGRFAPEAFEAVGVTAALDAALEPALWHSVLAVTLVAGASFCAGWRFAVSGPAFALLLLFVTSYRSSFGMVFHTENLLVLHVAVLALAPSADALSLDAERRANPPREDGRHGWPVRCLCLATVLTYLLAGIAKLENSGWGWFSGEVLRQQIAWDNLRKIELGAAHSPLGVALVQYPSVWVVLGLATLALELLAPLAMWDGIARRARVTGVRVAGVGVGGLSLRGLWVGGIWLFHAGVLALMAVLFPYPLLGFAFLPFFPVERLVAARLRGPAQDEAGESQGANPAR